MRQYRGEGRSGRTAADGGPVPPPATASAGGRVPPPRARTRAWRTSLAVVTATALAGGCSAYVADGGDTRVSDRRGPGAAPVSRAPAYSQPRAATAASPGSSPSGTAHPGRTAAPGRPSGTALADNKPRRGTQSRIPEVRESGTGDPAPVPPPRPPRTTRVPAPPARVLWRPGDRGPKVREIQARLRRIAWLLEGPTGRYDTATTAAVRDFQGKRGLPRTGTVDTVTWQRLTAMTPRPTDDELYADGGRPADTPDPRCLTGRALCVSKTSRTLTWLIDGKVRATMDVRFGGRETPTREGAFRVLWKSRDHVSTLYDTPMPYAMFFSGGQAVHYSSDFAATGYGSASHGCVNVRDKAAIAALFAQVRDGDKVIVHW